MDLTSGIFTAPRPGIYFFSFTGHADFYSSSKVYLGIGLFLNGGLIGTGYVEEANTNANQKSPLTLQSTLNLKKGDQVWVEINYQSTGDWVDGWMEISSQSDGTALYDDSDHFTHFTGFMLEEEIVASL